MCRRLGLEFNAINASMVAHQLNMSVVRVLKTLNTKEQNSTSCSGRFLLAHIATPACDRLLPSSAGSLPLGLIRYRLAGVTTD